MLSIILPAYNEEQMINIATQRLDSLLKIHSIEYEIVFVDDGSSDNTWNLIEQESNINQNVRGIHFSRNFGKEAAILAGLNEVRGDCSVVMDCDLQHPPEVIIEMYHLWKDGYEIIEGVKAERGKEGFLHKLGVKCFYNLIGKVSGLNIQNTSDFKLIDRKVIDILKHLNEKNAFFRAMTLWVGFKKTSVCFDVQKRIAGESKWSSKALTRYAINNITSFSTIPMQFVTILGVLTFVTSIVFGIISLIQKFNGSALEGFTTIIILQLLFSSIIMISIGIVGYYIARIFEEVKNRPIYIISEKCGRENLK